MRKVFTGLLILSFVFGLSSCDFINGILNTPGGGLLTPDYVGTWENVNSTVRVTYTFERDAFEMLQEMQIAGSTSWTETVAVKGTVSVSGDTMDITSTHKKEATIVSYSPYTLGPLPAEWTELSDTESDENSGLSTWSVDGDELTLTLHDPEPEQVATVVYTRVE